MVKISKTYIPKETEKYMCPKHLAFFKKKLSDWKTDLKRTSNEAIYNSSLDDNSTSEYRRPSKFLHRKKC